MVSLNPFSLVGIGSYMWTVMRHSDVLVEPAAPHFESAKWAMGYEKYGMKEEILRVFFKKV